jgi:hypothetical protein
MENQLYVRIRGRVLGPYDQEKLQSLARRGQLGRMHELSPDATNWVQASTYPELFVSENHVSSVVTQQVSSQTTEAVRVEGHQIAAKRWWYRANASEVGPVEQVTLQQMLASGKLSSDDYVWAEGMSQWLPARQIPDLLSLQVATWPQQSMGGPSTGPTDRKSELSLSLCKTATNSCSWVVFIAIVAFVYAGLAILAGIFALIHGANHHLPEVVAWGLFELIFGVDVAAGGFLLSNYASRMRSLRYSYQDVVLEKALDTLHTFWIYVSINLIVILALFVFFVVWIIAVAGSFPWPM